MVIDEPLVVGVGPAGDDQPYLEVEADATGGPFRQAPVAHA